MSAPQLQRTWSAEDVEADLRATLDVVAHLDPPDDLRLAVFNVVAQLVTQRAMQQPVQQQAVMFDPRMLGKLPGH